MFFCEIYEIFQNTYFEEHLWTTSEIFAKIVPETTVEMLKLPLSIF